MKKYVIIGVIIAAILIFGGLILMNSNDKPTATNNQASISNSSSTGSSTNSGSQNGSNSDNSSSATITYTDSGFSPATLTVKAGTTVTIINTSSQTIQFDSDPHPAHTDDPELNVGTIAPGESKTFKATTTGTFGFHNHLDPNATGTLVVQ